jgi:hypothetical protein
LIESPLVLTRFTASRLNISGKERRIPLLIRTPPAGMNAYHECPPKRGKIR